MAVAIWVDHRYNNIDRYYFKRFVLPEYNLFKPEKPKLDFKKSPLTHLDYRVQPGDSFWNIAKKFGLNIDTIVSYNNPSKVHVIQYGSTIRIPAIDGLIHERTPDQDIKAIAFQYRISETKLLFFNPKFYETNQIFVPGAVYNLTERMGKLGTELLKPLVKIKVTALYGFRVHPITKKRSIHKGIDLGGAIGTKVYSAKGGLVTFSGISHSYGNLVVLKHNKGYVTRYAHLDKIMVKRNQRVSAQMIIGTLGMTGRVTGPHLHFEVWKDGRVIDPRDVTDFH